MYVDYKPILFKRFGGYMKALIALMVVIALSGCAGGEFFPKGYGHRLAYKCQIDPYYYECLTPSPAFKN
jgi:hypothetical protein